MPSRRAQRDHEKRAQREVRLFFLLTFLYSWTLWGLAALSRRDTSKPPAALLHVLGGIGPSLIGAMPIHDTLLLVSRSWEPQLAGPARPASSALRMVLASILRRYTVKGHM